MTAAERFTLVEVCGAPCISQDETRMLVLLDILDAQDASMRQTLVEVQRTDGKVLRCVVGHVNGQRHEWDGCPDRKAFIEGLRLHERLGKAIP